MAALLTRPPGPAEGFHSGFSSAAALRNGFDQPMSCLVPEVEVVHVAVGKSVEKTAALLQWSFSMFPGKEVCLIHVHRPSPLIPTLLGKLPASRASPEIVAAFRNEEIEERTKLLSTYLMICSRSRVEASTIVTEADEVQKGIVNLVHLHSIRKLVVGAIPEFMKGKKSSCKACRVSKHAPPYCEMWFVKKGKLIWTRQASASLRTSPTSCHLATSVTDNFRSCSLNSVPNEEERVEKSRDTLHSPRMSSISLSSCTESATSTQQRESSMLSEKLEEGRLCIQIVELQGEVDVSKDEANLMLLEQKNVEVLALAAINAVKALESSHFNEVKHRIDAEDALRIAIQEQEKLLEERERINRELQTTMRNIAVLDSRAQEANCRCQEVGEELKLIQTSIATLCKERQKLQRQKTEATRWLHRWRSNKQCKDANGNEFIGLDEGDSYIPEFSLSDLESATCCFSESFTIGRGGYGVVYKGEVLDKTVAVKKLHFYNMQRQLEFHREVRSLGRLHHPNLVELIGVCWESYLLVYEYLPHGSLRERLSGSNIKALTWKTRTRIVADIASGLLFLHSFGPKRITHGNLKPTNILMDSQNRCKISDYVDHMLTSGQTARCPSFRGGSGSSGVCLYTDPESHRTGRHSHKSDLYSLGVITLQLVIGKTSGGLVGEARRAISRGEVASISDTSAGEWPSYVARRLVELGSQWCELNGRDRPELTSLLVKELQCLPFLEEQTVAVPSFFLCPILREIMHDPQVAADGFTYEGEAIHEWLVNGHQTSPMTNAELSDLNLTPNHSLRLAIQEWIANHVNSV